MRRIAFAIGLGLLALLPIGAQAADNAIVLTPGTGVTERSKDIGGGVQSIMIILGDTSGNPLATAPGTGNTVFALPTQGVSGGFPAPSNLTQILGAAPSLTNPLWVSPATGAVFAANPGTAANWGIGAFGSAMPTNGQGIGLYDGTNMVRARGDETNGIWVNIKSGAGSGGTALGDEGAFIQGTTNTTPMGCLFTSSVTNLTTGQAGAARCTNDRQQMVSDAALLSAVEAPLAAESGPTHIGDIAIIPSASSALGIVPGISASSAASSVVLKSAAGNLYDVYARSATAGWLMVFNATSAPSDGSTTAGIASGNLQDCVPAVQAQTGEYIASISYVPGPVEVFATGITAVYSSTSCGTKTASASAFIHGRVQ